MYEEGGAAHRAARPRHARESPSASPCPCSSESLNVSGFLFHPSPFISPPLGKVKPAWRGDLERERERVSKRERAPAQPPGPAPPHASPPPKGSRQVRGTFDDVIPSDPRRTIRPLGRPNDVKRLPVYLVLARTRASTSAPMVTGSTQSTRALQWLTSSMHRLLMLRSIATVSRWLSRPRALFALGCVELVSRIKGLVIGACGEDLTGCLP